MANLLYFWDGTTWQQIAYGGGGSGGGIGPVGPQGPAGSDGHSVEVYGPQFEQPPAAAKGDVWLASAALRATRKNTGVVASSVPVKKIGAAAAWRPNKFPTLRRRKSNG